MEATFHGGSYIVLSIRRSFIVDMFFCRYQIARCS